MQCRKKLHFSYSIYKGTFFASILIKRHEYSFKISRNCHGEEVSVLPFYSDDPSSNPTEVNTFCLIKLCEMTATKRKSRLKRIRG